MGNHAADSDLYAGLSGLELEDQEINFGHGITLRPIFAHIFTTDILAFERPATPNSYHPGPWQANSHKKGIDIRSELFIPKEYRHHKMCSINVAKTIIVMLRLWTDPAIALQLITDCPITELKDRKYVGPDAKHVATLVAGRERHIQIGLQTREKLIQSIEWIVEHWEDALNLRASSPEFDFALETFDNAQLIPNSAMMLVSLWGALEAIFAQSNAELRFRVSANIAAFLVPRGKQRLEKQQEVLKLYDKRSSAAHGNPKHGPEELIKTFELLRHALIRMTEQKAVPTKASLEELLFAS